MKNVCKNYPADPPKANLSPFGIEMASNIPDFSYCCEICGLEGLSEDEFRTHTHTAHVDGNAVCPFCELSAVSPAEMILHVNQAHLDFLTPESEQNMSFIDDPSPGECNGINGENNWNFPSYSSNNQNVSGEVKSNINNINLNPKVNGGGESSPKNSSHGQGSPLRTNLALKLKSSAPKLQCPMCKYTSLSPNELEEHVNRSHFDLTSPSLGGTTAEVFPCPLCIKTFNSAPDLELHVNIEHRDILSPASPPTHACPVCGIAIDSDSNGCSINGSEAAIRHVESHFPAGSPQPAEKAALREREQREFEMLRAQYGMDNQGNFREQSVTNMQRAVYAGEMSVADYYERTLDLRAAESCGVDDGSSVTRSIVPRVKAMSNNATNVVRTLLCTCVDHYASSYGDRGWGCGYRNTQMLFSSLLTHTGYNERLYKLWQGQKPPRSSGSEQLGCRLVNTRKWIGATEVVTLLSFLRIKCQLVDFHRPTGPGGSHPDLFNWVLKYFESSVGGEFTAPPISATSSRTIMGIEVHRDGSLVLLVLDPSHSPQQMAQFGDTNSVTAALRLLRKSEAAMKARQYQIVAIVGMIDSEQQYQVMIVVQNL
ncbi:hypothetical protein NQ314_005312 [Rhamnusium bicolor]|uniref:Zinc finger-containing ubiquitin peptidase 1 n=1 Tax=Rhamnusium bicolor TaxID=1586634 RepID=A0AAV8ZJ47_9CUCU|nr:hypothetical protein NQ314_005312 [Rhamnusium bicolor]